MIHHHIINGFSHREQWIFLFKKLCSFVTKTLNFAVSEPELTDF